MSANQILIAVIGLFFLITGLLYIQNLKKKEDAGKREKNVSYALVLFGLLICLLPFLGDMEFGSGSHRAAGESSQLLGEDAYRDAVLLKSSKNHPEAIRWYEKAMTYWNTEYAMFDSTEKALECLNKSLENYETAEALTTRGQLKVQMSDMSTAMVDYERAVVLKPDYPNAYFNRGALNYIFGNKTRACEDWKKAMDLGLKQAATTYTDMCL